jgi:drug/metabolite transporter (DMT)-like permease
MTALMVWFIFALLGAIFDATYYAFVKKALKSMNPYVLASGVFLFEGIVLLIISLIRGIPAIGSWFYLAVIITTVINIIATILYYKAFSITDLSLAVPMLAFTPIFLVFTSFFILRESTSFFGLLGILLVVIGSYILNSSREKGFLAPFKQFFRNKGVVLMLIVAVMFSISVNFDKLAVTNSDPIFGIGVVSILLGLFFLFFSISKKCEIKSSFRKNFSLLALMGTMLVGAAIFVNLAYTMQNVSYVIAIKRLSIVFSVVYGGLMFREKDMLRRVLGAAIMLLGVVFIIIL